MKKSKTSARLTAPAERLLETLEGRQLFSGSPVPDVTIDLPPENMINEDFMFAVEFDNSSTTASDVGYAPYVDLSVPDGIDLNSATYLGSPVTLSEAGVFDAGGNLIDPVSMAPVLHPMTGLPVTGGTPGEVLYVLEMPFGSFVPDQPNAVIDINATLNSADGAIVGTAMDVTAQGGFALGCDPLDNPGSDPPITGAVDNASITPIVVNLIKEYNAEDGIETATGPSFPVTYTLTVDIANGETLTNIDIEDYLPNSFVYLNDVTVTTAAGVTTTGLSITDVPTTGAPQNAPNNDFLIEFGSATGTTADDDIVITYSIFVNDVDANGNPVIDPVTGDVVPAGNDSSITADHSSGPQSDDDDETDITLEQSSLAVQKDFTIASDVGGTGPTPGDVIEYTIEVQVSDYFSFSDVQLDDNFSDGQLFDTSFTPTFDISENGTVTSGSFGSGNFTVMPVAADGSTDVHFDVFAEVPDGVLDGDQFADMSLDGGTIVTVTFRTIIQEDFTTTFPSGDPSVDIGDILTNDVVVSGMLPSGETEEDDSGTSFSIEGPAITKAVFAIDGQTILATDDIVAGHTMTYRITLELPSVDVENLVLTDYLPLPIFDASEVTTYDPGGPTGTPPAAGSWTYGPLHDLHTVVPATDPPAISTDPVANTIAWDFGTFDATPSTSATIDLLFTVTSQDVLMADGLFLTNQVLAEYGTTNSGETNSAAIAPTVVAAPELELTKGIVSTDAATSTFDPTIVGPVMFDAPGTAAAPFAGGIDSVNLATSPIDSNLTGIDAGDLVKFALTIENTGGADGYNLNITDALPAGFQIPSGATGLNLFVQDGDGNVLTYAGAPADLFTTGIEIDDPSVFSGAINNFDDAQSAGDGSNIIIITFDLEATIDVEPNQTIVNNAAIDEYGAVDGGNDHTDGSSNPDWEDDATVTTRGVDPVKSLVSTSEAHTGFVPGFERVAIGEIVRYRLAVEVPEGTLENFQLRDRLPAGLQFVNDSTATVAFVSNNGGIVSNDTTGALNLAIGAAPQLVGNEATVAGLTPTFVLGDDSVGSSASTGANLDAYNSGTDVYFKLGDVVNSDDDADLEYVIVEFNAMVLNNASNDHGDNRRNDFNATFTDMDGSNQTVTSNDVDVRIVEPRIDNVMKSASPTTGDAGDVITFTITFSNASGSTIADAFDVQALDTLPADYVLDVGSVNVVVGAGVTGVTNASAGNTVDVTFDQIESGGNVTITYEATLVSAVTVGDDIVNTVDVDYTSLPGEGTVGNPTGSDTPGASGDGDGERNGDGGTNDYADSAQANVMINAPSVAKSLLSTSIVDTTNANNEAVIGETAQYQVIVTMPEGVTDLAELIDTLDAGLSFVSFDSISASAALSSDTVNLNDSTTITPVVAGQVVTIPLGTISNTDVDNTTAETITLTYTVLIDNVAGNQGEGTGTMLDNSALMQWDVDGTTTTSIADDAEDIEVIEPDLDVAKSVAPLSADSGDPITYTITVSHNPNSDTHAYDVTFSDPIPADVIISGFTATHSTMGDISALFQLNGNTLETVPGMDFDLLLFETVTITVDGTLASSVQPGTTLTNFAEVEWTSLDGDDPGERDGDGGVDDYEDSGSADLEITAPVISKTLIGTSIDSATNANNEAVIGELVQYEVTFSIPEGVLMDAHIIDNLDVGLEFVSIDSIVGRSGGLLTSDILTNVGLGDFSDTASFNPTITGQQLDFDLGDINNTDTDNPTVEQLTIRYTVRVTDVATNQTETDTMLDNSAHLAWSAGGTPAMTADVDAEDVEVIEPELEVTKTVDESNPHLGDTVTFSITIDHTAASDTDAFDLSFLDTLPAGMTLDLLSLNVSGAGIVSNNSSGNAIDLELDQLLLGAGPITITYDAEISSDPAFINMGLNNTGTVGWTSLPGDDPGERDDDGGVDDYTDSEGETVTPIGPDLSIEKDDSLTTVSAGQTYTYAITVTNTGTDFATGITVTDTLPLNVLSFVSTDDAANVTFDATTGLLTWTPPAPLDFAAGSNTMTLNVTVQVNDPLDAGIDSVTNTASVAHDDIEPTPDDTTDDDTDIVTAAPDYVITKDDGLTGAEPGDTITYTIDVSNVGTQDGTGVIVTDAFPINALSIISASTGGIVDAGAGTITWNLGALDAGDSQVLTVTAMVLDPVGAGIDDFTNSVSVMDDGMNGDDPTPDNNSDDDTDTLDAAPDYTITKDDSLTNVTAGQAITYTITVSNVGNQDGTGVVVSDTFPTNVLENVAADLGGIVDAAAGTITWNVGNLAAGDSIMLTVTANVVDPLPAGIDEFTNTVNVGDDGANGDDPTPDNNEDDDTDTIDAAPDYTIVKDDGLTEAQPGDSITYTITVNNVGDQGGTGVVVSDTFPTNVLENVAADMGGVVDAAAGTITWNIGNLDAGDSIVLTVTADVMDPIGAGIDDFTNTANVGDDGANGDDPTPDNNEDEDTDTLDAAPDYTITKDDGLTGASPGDTIVYTITVQNVGDQDGTGIVISDSYPTNVLTNVVVSEGGVIGAATGMITWNLATLDAGETRIITVTADVLDPVASGIDDFTNTVSVTDDGTNGDDPTPDNNSDDDTNTLDAAPDYVITKDDSVSIAAAGDSITYTITVQNVGDQDGTGVMVNDTFPTNILENVAADTGGVIDAVAGTIVWNLGNLDAGDTVILTVTADIVDPTPSGVDEFTNTVNVSDDGANGDDPTPDNNSDDDTDMLGAAPDYTIVKDDGLTNVSPGETITYTITVSNVGNQNGTGVVVSDTFPTNVLENVAADTGGVVDPVAGTITWNIGDLDAGDSVILTVTADVVDPLPAGIDDFTNTADVGDDGANGDDPTPENNMDEDTDTLDAEPDYTIVKDDGLTEAQPGDSITYTITVNNVGDQNGTGVVVSDTFPSDVLENVTASAGGSVDPVAGTITWNLGNLDAGDSVILTVTADVLDPAGAGIEDFTNTASVTDDGSNGDDPTPDNNMDDDTDTLDAAPDYVINKDDALTEAEPGDTITYTITVQNVGDQDGTGIVISDSYPTNVLTNVIVSDGGVIDAAAGTITWNLATLDADETRIITVTADVLDPVGAGIDDFTNTVNVTDDGSGGPDPTPGNNTDDDTNILDAVPDYVIAKDDALTEAAPGDTITYTITVQNVGDQDGTGVIVSDTFPASVLENVTASMGGAVNTTAGTISWNLGNLDAGDTVVLTVTADVVNPAPAGVDEFTNLVSVTDDGANGDDPTPDNNMDDDTDDLVAAPDYTITKDDGLTNATTGQTISYTITVSNVGTQDGTGIIVSDTFPTHVLENVTASNGGVVDAVAGTITWNLGDLDQGDTVVLTVTADVLMTVDAGIDDFTNTASVTDDGTNGDDPTPDNNMDDDTDILDATPDLVVTKTDGVIAVTSGDSITYTISVENVGDQAATGVTVQDLFPNTVLLNVAADMGGVVNTGAGSIDWNLGTIAAGDTVTLTVTADIPETFESGLDEFTNSVTVSDDGMNGDDPTPENNMDEDTDVVMATPDLTITKNDGITTASTGDSITYTITVRNVGDQDASNVVVNDVFPNSILENVVASGGGAVDIVAGTITWNIPTVAAGDILVLTVNADVQASLPAGTVDFTNTAMVTDDGSNGDDPTPSNNMDADTDNIDGSVTPDYVLRKFDGLSAVSPGDHITYTIEVSNVGDQNGTGVVVTDTLPTAFLTNVTADMGGVVDLAAGTVTWNLGNLDAGDTVILTIEADVLLTLPSGANSFTNLADVADDGTNGPDPTPDNNMDEDTDLLNAVPDYTIVKDDGLAEAQPGDTITYTLTVENVGSQDGTGVVVQDVFPTDVLVNVVASGGGIVDPIAGTIQWNIGNMDVGDVVVLTVTADVMDPIGSGIADFTNTANVADDGTNGDDPTPENNMDEDTDILDAAPDYVVTKDDGLTEAQPGDTITYTITVDNVGNQDGTGVVLTDVFQPAALTNISADLGGIIDLATNSITWNLGNLDVGDTIILTVTAEVIDPAEAGLDDFTNSVSVTDDLSNGQDPTPENNMDEDTDTLDAAPDYTIDKDNGLSEVAPGDIVVYNIVVENVGNQDGTGIVITDDYLPAILDIISVSDSGLIDASAGTITWFISDLGVGESVILTVTAQVENPVPAGYDDLVNTVSVTDDGTNGDDPTPDNNMDDDTDPLNAAPDYTIAKDDGLTEAAPGDTITYTLTVANVGNQDGTGVIVTDTFPTNVLTNVSADNGGIVDPVTGTVTWNLGAMAAGDTVVLTITADVMDTVGAGIDDFTNSAAVADDGTNGDDPTPDNNTDEDTDVLNATPGYVIVKDDGLDHAHPGDTITYTLTVSHDGNQDGTGVVVTDTFPTGVLTNVMADNGGIVDPVAGTVTWNLGAVSAGDTIVLTITADVFNTVGAGIDEFTNLASVNDDGTNGDDPTPENNTDEDTNPLEAAPDYVATKDNGITEAAPGDTITYTITVANVGNQDGTGVVITDTLPISHLNNVTASDGGIVDAVNGTITWNLASLDAGDSMVLTVTADVNDTIGSGVNQFTNSVSVTDDGANGDDPTPENNMDDDTDVVNAAPDYQITKDDGITEAAPGETITYTITVANVGNQDGTNLTVLDSFPLGIFETIVADSGGVVDAANGTITWNLAELHAGDSITLRVTAGIADSFSAGIDQFTNSVNVADDGTNGDDPTLENNEDSDTDVLDAAPILNIVKSDGGATAGDGDTVIYTITYSNTGNQDATGVVITETLPPGTRFNSGDSSNGWVDIGGGQFEFYPGTLTAGEVRVIAFALIIDDVAVTGDEIQNTASIRDDGQNGGVLVPINTTTMDATPIEMEEQAFDLSLISKRFFLTSTPSGVYNDVPRAPASATESRIQSPAGASESATETTHNIPAPHFRLSSDGQVLNAAPAAALASNNAANANEYVMNGFTSRWSDWFDDDE